MDENCVFLRRAPSTIDGRGQEAGETSSGHSETSGYGSSGIRERRRRGAGDCGGRLPQNFVFLQTGASRGSLIHETRSGTLEKRLSILKPGYFRRSEQEVRGSDVLEGGI